MAPTFGPGRVAGRGMEEVAMTLDEFEAVRLSDLDGLYQEEASGRMNVSRATFSRIVDSAHRKIADALVHGKSLKIEGGPVVRVPGRQCCHRHDMKFPTLGKTVSAFKSNKLKSVKPKV